MTAAKRSKAENDICWLIVVDSLGLLIAVVVHAAGISETAGARDGVSRVNAKMVENEIDLARAAVISNH